MTNQGNFRSRRRPPEGRRYGGLIVRPEKHPCKMEQTCPCAPPSEKNFPTANRSPEAALRCDRLSQRLDFGAEGLEEGFLLAAVLLLVGELLLLQLDDGLVATEGFF